MHHRWSTQNSSMVIVVIWIWTVWSANSSQAEIDVTTVQRSIDRGVAFLRAGQNARGGWNEYQNQSCGLSSLCTLAMLNAGVPAKDPDLVRAIGYLRSIQPRETYSVALQTLVFCQVGAAGDLQRIRRNVNWLTRMQLGNDAFNRGAWAYDESPGRGDPSNSQFALLALGAAAERGIRVEPMVFQNSIDYWRRQQLQRGGWGYGSNSSASGSMTCAGIASLLIARAGIPNPIDASIQCCGEGSFDESIEKGIEYLGQIFSSQHNPGDELRTYFYYMYAVERVGRLTGRRLIGQTDWYREGAETLVGRQDSFQGFWQGKGAAESNRFVATSFAVLFLSKGKRQVVVGRLEHPTLQANHADALRQLVRHVEKDWRRDLTWQTISGQRASVTDLLQTPVIVITGQSELRLGPKLIETLKAYLDQGGTLLFDAQAGDGCGNADAFQSDVVQLCQQWYPGATIDRLSPTHPIWFAQKPADPAEISNDFWMYGVGACCRTPVFYSPRSLTCRWSYGDRLLVGDDIPPPIADSVGAAIAIGENLVAYATGRELKDKLDASQIVDGTEAPPAGRSAVTIASGALGAGERQVPRALPNAASLIRDRLAVEVIAVDEPMALTESSLSRVGAVYLHGQTEFQLTPTQRDALRVYLQRYGILIGTPICGSEAFEASFRREIDLILGEDALTPMPPDHPAFTTRFGGYDLRNVTIRIPRQAAARSVGGLADDGVMLTDIETGGREGPLQVIRRTGSPEIEFARVDDVTNVFFSPLDLSCALESQNSIQCPGYETTDAARIVAGLLLYALQQ
ncbi:MAG: DUF4159 domain-containing protein [Planctomycetota bacterium]